MSKVKAGIVLLFALMAVAGRVYAAGVAIPSGAALSLNTASLGMPGDIANSGTLQSSTGAITVYGNWSNTGTFTPGSGDVTFTGASTHTVSGSTGFYNLACAYAGSGFTFESGRTQTITSALTLTGASGNSITLRSSASGTQWKIDPQGTRNVSWVDVQDSSNISGTLINPTNWTDSGNNSSWVASGGATGVSVDTAISATFSLLMNGATINTSTFKVSVGTHTTVSGAVTTSGYSATFTPSSNLNYDTTYTATITTGASAAKDVLTTAIRVSGVNYYSGDDLLLDLHEDGINSGTFLATIRTGTATAGGAGLSARSNTGTIKTVHGGTATVMYANTTPNASTVTKTLTFCNFDATLEFDAESYTIGDYAVILHGDAANTSGNPRQVTAVSHVVGTATPTPAISPVVTPTPAQECEAKTVMLSHKKLKLRVNKKRNIRVTLTGEAGCAVEGEGVMVRMDNGGRRCVTVSPASAVTDADGNAVFTVMARKQGKGKITFEAGEVKKRLEVKVEE